MALLDAAFLQKLDRLVLRSRKRRSGVRGGERRSIRRGQSQEFADHRPYVAGDDLRHLDWKVLGRTDRLVLKRYEAETDLACTLCVDGSASMAYQGRRATVTKYRYSCVLAASLAYLVLRAQDRAALVLFADDAVATAEPGRQDQLRRICRLLEDHQPAGGTDAGTALERLAAPAVRRGLVILVSDLLDPPETIASAVDRLRHRGHDLALVWVLDPDERDLGLDAVGRFTGLEGGGELVVEPRALQRAYLEEVAAHRLALEKLCRSRGALLVEARTDEAPQHPLNRLLVALQHEGG